MATDTRVEFRFAGIPGVALVLPGLIEAHWVIWPHEASAEDSNCCPIDECSPELRRLVDRVVDSHFAEAE